MYGSFLPVPDVKLFASNDDDEEELFGYIYNFPIQMICMEKCDGTLDELFEKDLMTLEQASYHHVDMSEQELLVIDFQMKKKIFHYLQADCMQLDLLGFSKNK